jgi:molecular chaperone GrpE (heat shock protein)
MHDDLEQPEPTSAGGNASKLEAWKGELRQQFESWLESVEEMPEIDERTDVPDLYALYEELTALRNETRKGNRKMVEVFSQFGEGVDRFQDEIKRLREQLSRSESARGDHQALPRSYFLALVELIDRMQRLETALERPPQPGRLAFLNSDGRWRKAWSNWRQGFSILVTHFEKLVEQAGVQRMNTIGKTFDPVTMLAVAAVAPIGRPLNVVVEEVAPGYHWRDEVLRPADVKITKSEL